MAQSRLAMITFIDNSDYPDNSLPGQPVYPSQGLPGYGNRPDNSLPGGIHISQLPVYPFDPTKPDNSLPGQGNHPDNELPRPGKRYVVKWLACQGLILVPDNSLPDTATPEPK